MGHGMKYRDHFKRLVLCLSVAAMSVVATYGTQWVMKQRAAAMDTTVRGQLMQLRTAIDQYNAVYGQLPQRLSLSANESVSWRTLLSSHLDDTYATKSRIGQNPQTQDILEASRADMSRWYKSRREWRAGRIASFLAIVPDEKHEPPLMSDLAIVEVLGSDVPWTSPRDISEAEFWKWAGQQVEKGDAIQVILPDGVFVKVCPEGVLLRSKVMSMHLLTKRRMTESESSTTKE